MPTYSYRCHGCGPFGIRRPMSAVTGREPCPTCGSEAARTFDSPALRRTSPAVRSALAVQERSADAPEVVTSVPPSPRRTPVTTDPRHLALPRP